MQGRWLFPIKAAGTGTPTVFEKTPMSDGPHVHGAVGGYGGRAER